MGYWEQRMNAGPEGYFKIDELVIDDNYIGPPPNFVGSIPLHHPTPDTYVQAAVPSPTRSDHAFHYILLMVSDRRANFSWSTDNRAYAVLEYGLTPSYGSNITWFGDDRGKNMNMIRLNPATTYYYRITSTEANNPQSISVIVGSLTTLNEDNTPVVDTTAPGQVLGLAATSISSSQINLSWDSATDNVGVTGYRIYRNGTQIDTTASTNHADLGLTPSTTYSYTVAAYDAAGNVGIQSSSASATTQNVSGNGDVNNDGDVNLLDIQVIVADFGKTSGYNSRSDQNSDGAINIYDVMVVVRNWE
jgi:chitodextrinase